MGLSVVAVDRNPEAPGLEEADVAEVVDFSDVDAVVEVARRHAVDGVLTISADRAVPVVAAVAEALGLPGIGTDTAYVMTQKIAMRRVLADAGVPQPEFAAVRNVHEGYAALERVGLPAVLKPADSGGQRGVFRLETADDLERHLHVALGEPATGEAIVEAYVDQLEEAERVAVHAVRALGLRDGIAFPQLLVTDDGRALVIEVAARIPGGQMADLARHAVGVDLVEIALLQALGDEVPDEVARPRFAQPLAIRFLTASPGPLPTGTVKEIGSLEKVSAFPGVVQADLYLSVGETIRPVQLDGDRRGYVIAIADTNVEALERAEAAAQLVDVVVE